MLRNLTILFMCLVLFACNSEKQVEGFVYWVNSYKVDCVGAGPMKCMLIQKGNEAVAGEWQNFYTQIEGFDYRPGFIYKLLVKEEKIQNPPADASSIKYSLIKVIEKKADLKLNINDIWVATSISAEEIELPEEQSGKKIVNLEIHLAEMRVMGSDGCNSFNGAITRFDDGILELGPIASTRMMCPDMTIPDKFNTALNQVKKYKLENGKLYKDSKKLW